MFINTTYLNLKKKFTVLNKYKDYFNKDMNYSNSFELKILFIINMVKLLNHSIIQIFTLYNIEIHSLFFLKIIEGGRKIIN